MSEVVWEPYGDYIEKSNITRFMRKHTASGSLFDQLDRCAVRLRASKLDGPFKHMDVGRPIVVDRDTKLRPQIDDLANWCQKAEANGFVAALDRHSARQ